MMFSKEITNLTDNTIPDDKNAMNLRKTGLL